MKIDEKNTTDVDKHRPEPHAVPPHIALALRNCNSCIAHILCPLCCTHVTQLN